jgi:hypothetical protein
MNHGAMRCSVNGNADQSELEMKASLVLGLAAALGFVASITTFAAGNVQKQSEDTSNKDVVLRTINDEMKDWRQRVETYLAAAKAKSERPGPDLHGIWDQAKATSLNIVLATETGWDRAKSAVGREWAALKADRQ